MIKSDKFFYVECDKCNDYLENSEGGMMLFSNHIELEKFLESTEWKIENMKTYCPHCIKK